MKYREKIYPPSLYLTIKFMKIFQSVANAVTLFSLKDVRVKSLSIYSKKKIYRVYNARYFII